MRIQRQQRNWPSGSTILPTEGFATNSSAIACPAGEEESFRTSLKNDNGGYDDAPLDLKNRAQTNKGFFTAASIRDSQRVYQERLEPVGRSRYTSFPVIPCDPAFIDGTRSDDNRMVPSRMSNLQLLAGIKLKLSRTFLVRRLGIWAILHFSM